MSALQVSALHGERGQVPNMVATSLLFLTLCAVTGSHRELPGTHGGALHGAWRAPTWTDGSDGMSRVGKGVKGLMPRGAGGLSLKRFEASLRYQAGKMD